MPKTTAIVPNLSEPLLHKGYTLWMDNYYNFSSSVQVSEIVQHRLCRHHRENRKAVPKKLQESKLQKDDAILEHSRPLCVLRWSDKKHVTMTSTYHVAEVQRVVKRSKEKQKPVCLIHYNQHMGGVEKKYQLLQMQLVERKE